jgi:hypothetical protein
LEGLSNYDDTKVESALSSLQTQFNTLVSGNASDAINSFNEIIAFLNNIEDSESLDSIIASVEQQIAGKQAKLVSGTNIKTINGTSILGSGDITIEGGSGSLTENDDITVKSITVKDFITVGDDAFTINSYGTVDANAIHSANGFTDYSSGQEYYMKLGDYGIEIIEPSHTGGGAKTILTTITSGDGTKFLSNDGTYKTISGGGSSGANVQAVDTGDVIDDVTVNYATKTYVDGLVGDINSVLESIING